MVSPTFAGLEKKLLQQPGGFLQVIDSKDLIFCCRFAQNVESRMARGFPGCQGGLAHKVVHSFCG